MRNIPISSTSRKPGRNSSAASTSRLSAVRSRRSRSTRLAPTPPRIEDLKQSLLREYAGAGPVRLLRAALREAEALAWQTAFPELVFPVLADEKLGRVRSWQNRQERILQSGPTLDLAA